MRRDNDPIGQQNRQEVNPAHFLISFYLGFCAGVRFARGEYTNHFIGFLANELYAFHHAPNLIENIKYTGFFALGSVAGYAMSGFFFRQPSDTALPPNDFLPPGNSF